MAIMVQVCGFHGTTRTRAQLILTNGFKPSEKDHDWLGYGIYFWQDAPTRAWEWARKRDDVTTGVDAPAVVGANIEFELGDYAIMDLLDSRWEAPLLIAYKELAELHRLAAEPMPVQKNKAHRLDCAVINQAVALIRIHRGIGIKLVRAAFPEGKEIFPGSAFYEGAHVQIALRDTSLIKGELWLEDPIT